MNNHFQDDKEIAANRFFSDPKVIKAKQELLEFYKEYQKTITKVCPPNPKLEQSYKQAIEDFTAIRGGKLWYPYIGSGMGNGALVELMDGSIKYDFICGIGPGFFGHSHPRLIEASLDAAFSDIIIQGNLQQNFDSLKLADLFKTISGIDHCFLSTSGAMAVENGLKIAFHKKFPANRIIAFEHCFSGRSLASSNITDKPAYRQNLPTTVTVDYIPFFDSSNPEWSIKTSVSALKSILKRYPKAHAAMLFELVQGEGGCYSGSRDFFVAIMDILKEHNIAIFVDEIQTFARTHEIFAYKYFGLENYVDICSIGKISLVCATLFRKEFLPAPGLLSQTFTSSSTAIAVTTSAIEMLLSSDLYGDDGKIARMHNYFVKKLKAIDKKKPGLIKGPFGLGALIAFTPYDGELKKVIDLLHRLFSLGVIAFVAGENPSRVRLLPPIAALNEKDIDEAITIIEKALLEEV